MFDSNAFFKVRFKGHMKELSRYLKYIFNGHIAFAMFFFIAATAYYYQQWLAQLPEDFPTALIIGTVFGLLISYSPVRTLLKEPDLVFLIVAEEKMKNYFRNALIYSFVIQLYLILLAAAALGPLYFAAYPNRAGNIYLLTIAVMLIFKLGNLIANWWMLKVRDVLSRGVDVVVRTIINILTFYFIIAGEVLFAGMTTIVFVIVFLYDYSVSRKQAGIHWELLVEKDQSRMQSFYRLANMFADVPHLKNKVKKRQWLVSMVSNRIPFSKTNTYDYLYRITFVRSGDYLGMYIRLIIVGGLFIYFIPNLWMKIFFVILFLYLSLFQMMALYQHHRTNMWLDLYPVEITDRKRAIVTFLYQLGWVQLILFAILFLLMQEYAGLGLVLAAGALFNIIFINGYVKKKIA